MGWVHALNERIANTAAGRYFELNARKSTFSTEVMTLLQSTPSSSCSVYLCFDDDHSQ
jgi:hypothetical protein